MRSELIKPITPLKVCAHNFLILSIQQLNQKSINQPFTRPSHSPSNSLTQISFPKISDDLFLVLILLKLCATCDTLHPCLLHTLTTSQSPLLTHQPHHTLEMWVFPTIVSCSSRISLGNLIRHNTSMQMTHTFIYSASVSLLNFSPVSPNTYWTFQLECIRHLKTEVIFPPSPPHLLNFSNASPSFLSPRFITLHYTELLTVLHLTQPTKFCHQFYLPLQYVLQLDHFKCNYPAQFRSLPPLTQKMTTASRLSYSNPTYILLE